MAESEVMALVYDSLVSGLSSYMKKFGFTSCVVGLSGGVDSALVAAIAADAVGKSNVLCVSMPSIITSPQSIEDATSVAHNLGAKIITMPIEAEYSAYVDNLLPHLKRHHTPNVVEENLQARIRANLLYALSNEHGYLVLNTSNKSEAMVGYGTLYGDMAGGYGVIAGVYKTGVYALARYCNQKAGKEIIPLRVIEKPPSAELRHNQKDEDDLMPYAVLDRILLLIEQGKNLDEIASSGFERETVARVLQLIEKSEFKRKMSPPCTRVDANLYKELFAGK